MTLNFIFVGKLFIEEYGWFLLFGLIILILLFNWLQPYFAKWLQKREDKAYYSKYGKSDILLLKIKYL